MAFQSWNPRLSGKSHLTCFGSSFLGAILVDVSLFLCPGCGLVPVLLLSCRVVDLLGFSFVGLLLVPGMWAFIVHLLAWFCSGLVLACARDVGCFWFIVSLVLMCLRLLDVGLG